jgi:ABC-2 type transport system permease protein
MSTMTSTAITDSTTMVRRNLLHMRRYPSLTLMLIGQPLLFLLLFVYVFGSTLGAGIAGEGGGRSDYLTYIVPAIVAMAVASVALGTAVSVASDMTQGLVSRFRTMPIARVSVLAGHVGGALVQTALSVAVTFAVAMLIGYRPDASALDWLGVAGIVLLFAFAMTWLTVALGVAADSVETASNTPMPLVLLPFLGSGFVPTESMPEGVQEFAEYQPFTPVMETLRGLLAGTPSAHDAVLAVGWCVVISVLSAIWGVRLYHRKVTG